jgi:3-deoxy-D-manno-octulosonate 8-phosphate phosphatase (KDO 8-P phosphatase)
MNHLESFHEVNTFLFDVDGVLTDSRILIMENGRLLRQLHKRDLLALKTALEKEYRVAILSSSRSDGIREQLEDLGVSDLYLGVDDKLEAYEELVDIYDLDEAGILYMGDDWPDYRPMRRVGMPVCPKDAIPEIVKICKYISPLSGGAGCVRDVIEKVLRLHHNWMTP